MKQLHTALKTTHHLRYFGRQQFTLFLKGIGLSLEDALTFWRLEFTKKMDSDQVTRIYLYYNSEECSEVTLDYFVCIVRKEVRL